LGGERGDAAEVAEVVDRTLAIERGDVARVAVDLDHDVLVRAELLLRRREEGALDALEDELLVDRLLTMERMDDPEAVRALHVHNGAHLGVLSGITSGTPAPFGEHRVPLWPGRDARADRCGAGARPEPARNENVGPF